MVNWKDIKEWNKKRKKGLKNPTVLWFWSFIATVLLTVVPSVFISYLPKADRSDLLSLGVWIQAIIGNLYPMMIAQSVVTMFQNFGIISPSQKEEESDRPTPRFGWTVVLLFCLVLYAIGYPLFILAAPPRLNAILCTISGVLAVLGLISTLQLDKEQEKIQKKLQEIQRVRMLQSANRALTGTNAPNIPPDTDVNFVDTGDESRSRSGTPVVK